MAIIKETNNSPSPLITQSTPDYIIIVNNNDNYIGIKEEIKSISTEYEKQIEELKKQNEELKNEKKNFERLYKNKCNKNLKDKKEYIKKYELIKKESIIEIREEFKDDLEIAINSKKNWKNKYIQLKKEKNVEFDGMGCDTLEEMGLFKFCCDCRTHFDYEGDSCFDYKNNICLECK